MSLENSNNSRINDELCLDYFIHVDKGGIRAGFRPSAHCSPTGEQVILCMALGIRSILHLLSDRMDEPVENIQEALKATLEVAFSADFADKIVRGNPDDEENKKDT